MLRGFNCFPEIVECFFPRCVGFLIQRLPTLRLEKDENRLAQLLSQLKLRSRVRESVSLRNQGTGAEANDQDDCV